MMVATTIGAAIEELAKCVEVEYSVECQQCGYGQFVLSGDSIKEAAREFYNEGWRWRNDELLCKECAE